jgi:hypothetical protein
MPSQGTLKIKVGDVFGGGWDDDPSDDWAVVSATPLPSGSWFYPYDAVALGPRKAAFLAEYKPVNGSDDATVLVGVVVGPSGEVAVGFDQVLFETSSQSGAYPMSLARLDDDTVALAWAVGYGDANYLTAYTIGNDGAVSPGATILVSNLVGPSLIGTPRIVDIPGQPGKVLMAVGDAQAPVGSYDYARFQVAYHNNGWALGDAVFAPDPYQDAVGNVGQMVGVPNGAYIGASELHMIARVSGLGIEWGSVQLGESVGWYANGSHPTIISRSVGNTFVACANGNPGLFDDDVGVALVTADANNLTLSLGTYRPSPAGVAYTGEVGQFVNMHGNAAYGPSLLAFGFTSGGGVAPTGVYGINGGWNYQGTVVGGAAVNAWAAVSVMLDANIALSCGEPYGQNSPGGQVVLLSRGLALSGGQAPPSGGDTFGTGTSILVSSAGVGRTTATDTTGYGTEPGEPVPGGFSIENTAWWRFTPQHTGQYLIHTQDSVDIGNGVDTVLAVYTGSSVGSLTSVGWDDDAGTGNTSLLEVALTAGTTYHIQAGTYAAEGVGMVVTVVWLGLG